MFKWLGSFIAGVVVSFILLALINEGGAKDLLEVFHQLMVGAIDHVVYFRENTLPEWAGVISDILQGLIRS